MNQRILRTVYAAACLALGACQDTGLPTNFGDGTWIFTVDRVWTAPEGGVDAPTDALDEADYTPTDAAADWSIWLSEHGKAVALTEVSAEETAIDGTRGDPVGDRLHYDLTAGVFAGGRFEVWDDGFLRAELTIYGSGVPIVSSARGDLVEIIGL
jgi:hypothetical protein